MHNCFSLLSFKVIGRKFCVSVSSSTQDRAVNIFLQVLQLHCEEAMTKLGERILGEK